MRRIINKIDKPLFVITIISLIFGLLMVGSASSLKAYMARSDSYFYFKRQLFFIIIGLIGSLFVLKIPIKTYKKYIGILVVGIIGALVYVLLKGEVSNGITGWLFISSYV